MDVAEEMHDVLRSREERHVPEDDHAVEAVVYKHYQAAEQPRWTAQTPPLIDTSNPAICGRRPRPWRFYFAASSGRKSVWTLVRQLRGPHLRTWA